VTILYVLANISYLSVLDPVAMVSSNAVAVTFSDVALGLSAGFFVPVLVAISALGGLSCHIMTSSRLCFVGARQGHFPDALALITTDSYTPKPALIFLGTLSLLYLGVGDIYSLIDYTAFVESMFILISLSGLLYLRYTQPNMERPIKLNLAIPITFVVITCFLVFMPLYVRPVEVGMGLLITGSGIPVYLVGVKWKNKPRWFTQLLASTTGISQKLFLGVKEEKQE
jgi:L-type amino acid transporter 5